jgi:hypothetical protein
MGDLRERRRLIRHLRDCTACRREAAAIGLAGLAVPSDDRRGLGRAFSRLAAFLPFPAFFGRRAGETEQISGAGSFTAQAQGAAAQLSTVAGDHVVSAVHKAAAVVAAVAVVGGSGVAVQKAGVHLPVKIPGFDSAAAKAHQGKPARAPAVARDGFPPAASRTPDAGRAGPAADPVPTSVVTHPEGTAGPDSEPQDAVSDLPPATTGGLPEAGPPSSLDPVTPSETAPADTTASSDPATTGGADTPPADSPSTDPSADSGGSATPTDGTGGVTTNEPEPAPGDPPPSLPPSTDPGPPADPGAAIP